jgi:hypothetical protein
MGLPEPVYVLSSDIKAFPGAIFDVEGVISVADRSKDKAIAHLNLITLNSQNYAGVAIQKV